MKPCIINFSNRKYAKGQERLVQTLLNRCNDKYAIRIYQEESQIGAKPHSERMYDFKPKSFLKAYQEGFRIILWLDASMFVLKDLKPIFDIINKQGYYAQDSGWMNDRWTTAEQKEYFGTDKGRMISSGVLGLNLSHPVGDEFLERWNQASDAGMFNGSHEVTRHDQLAASLIIENMGLEIRDNHSEWQYGKPDEPILHENILLIANGII